jgi:hypothetical protein
VNHQLQLQKIGRVLHHNQLPASIKDEIKLHARTIDIIKGVETQHKELPRDASEDVLKYRAAHVVEQIDKLATNLNADQETYQAPK